jgi:hypothetical protein
VERRRVQREVEDPVERKTGSGRRARRRGWSGGTGTEEIEGKRKWISCGWWEASGREVRESWGLQLGWRTEDPRWRD